MIGYVGKIGKQMSTKIRKIVRLQFVTKDLEYFVTKDLEYLLTK